MAKIPLKENLTENLNLVVGKYTTSIDGKIAYEISLTNKISLQLMHPFSDNWSGMYERVNPWAISPKSLNGFVDVRIDLTNNEFTQTEDFVGEPPLHTQPFSMKHPESQPSPSIKFPSSHSY